MPAIRRGRNAERALSECQRGSPSDGVGGRQLPPLEPTRRDGRIGDDRCSRARPHAGRGASIVAHACMRMSTTRTRRPRRTHAG